MQKKISCEAMGKITKIAFKTKDNLKISVKKASDNFVNGSDNCSVAIANSNVEYDNTVNIEYKKFVSGFAKGVRSGVLY